jgi:hypothetical protein
VVYAGQLFFGDKERFDLACAVAIKLPAGRGETGRSIANTPHLHHLLLHSEEAKSAGGAEIQSQSRGVGTGAVQGERESEEEYLVRTCR